MQLNATGKIASDAWLETVRIRPNIILGDFIVMPNHFHAVFAIDNAVCTDNNTPAQTAKQTAFREATLHSPSQTIGSIVRGYKSTVSNKVGFSIWQRNYYEHIIRNKQSLQLISQYIISNPTQWSNDCFS